MRVWHNGCAPAFQAGYTGSTPVTRSNLVGFPSGQRGQTVNLLAPLSMVRIHLPPPFLSSKRQQSLPFFTIYASNSRQTGYFKSNQSFGSRPWEGAKGKEIAEQLQISESMVKKLKREYELSKPRPSRNHYYGQYVTPLKPQ